jgi:predicted Zn finger-like uncharacterized protein
MDVRCDRCQTEYELEDESVTDEGATVQCTTCGHLFMVSSSGETLEGVPTPPDGVAELAGPEAADWLLATEDGRTHRFRDLTTLHKWIVERKVTREDRVSQKGGAWRRLGDVLELRPFFDVVAQADRARAADTAGAGGGAPRGFRPQAVKAAPAQSVRQSPRSQRGFDEGDEGQPRHRSQPQIAMDPDVDLDDELLASLRPRHRGPRVFAVVMFLGLAAAAAYAGFRQPHWLPFFKKADSSAPAAVAAPQPPSPPTSPSPPPSPSPPAVVPLPPPPPPVAPSAAAPGAGGPSRAADMPPVPAGTPADPPRQAAAPAEPPPSKGRSLPPRPGSFEGLAATKGKSYERLVADADRLLENGQTAKAQRLYDEALAMQPNGVAALTGSAFLLLDRHKPLAAISVFRRALAHAPGFAPALFGLAEAFRAQGDVGQAVDNYKKYLGVAPGGPDAPAAHRQLKELEGLRPAASESARPPESARAEERPAPTAPSPASTP